LKYQRRKKVSSRRLVVRGDTKARGKEKLGQRGKGIVHKTSQEIISAYESLEGCEGGKKPKLLHWTGKGLSTLPRTASTP